MHKAIFFDKDNTLIKDIPYNVDPDLIEPFPETKKALGMLAKTGYKLIIITNQSGVARGYFREEDLQPVQARMREIFGQSGAELQAFYYCPHHEEGIVEEYAKKCDCRKPEPGLFARAAKEHNLDLKQCWSIGDILHDIEPANRLGCQTILIDNGGETEWKWSPSRKPDYSVSNLIQAAQLILSKER